MIQTSKITIKQIHKKAWKAYFHFWDDSVDTPMKIEMEYGAPTKERLIEKLDHFKKTGIFLRD